MGQMRDSILNGVFIFSMFQTSLFSILIFNKVKKSLPDLIIGSFLILLLIQTILIFLIHNNIVNGFFSQISILLTLLYGPMQFLYIFKICSGSSRIKKSELFHFLPAFIFFILFIIYSNSVLYIKTLAISSLIVGLFYCFKTLFILKKHSVNIKNHFSSTEKVNLLWLNKLVYGYLLIWIGTSLLVFLNRILNFQISLDWFYTIVPFFVFYIGFNGFKQQVIFSYSIDEPEGNDSSLEDNNSLTMTELYKKSGLKRDQMQNIYEKMEQIMQNENLYLQSTLSLQELSKIINIPSHHITQTLNEYGQQNFYEFINGYRVNEFIKRVEKGDAKNFSLLGIAFDCGFNSKSSFNRIFKNSTGQTPSEYKIK